MMKESIFDSKKRTIKIFADRKPPFVVKRYPNRDDFIKEKGVIEEIGIYPFVPKLISIGNEELMEMYILGDPIDLPHITDQQLGIIANHLGILHAHTITKRFKRVFNNPKKNYCPFAIFKQIEGENPVKATKFTYYQLLFNLVSNFTPKRELSLIHGDLNATNFIIDESGQIFLIDWVESRIDYPLVDLANLAFQGDLGHRERQLFLSQYGRLKGEDKDLDILILLNAFFEYTSPYGDKAYAEKIAKKLVENVI